MGGQVFKSGNMPAGVSIIFPTGFTGDNVVFNRQGFPNDSGSVGSVTLSNNAGTSRVINLRLSGNARIQ